MRFSDRAFLLAFFLSIIFFIITFITLKDYGVSWDEVLHYRRAQAYLHYFLTGETDYSSLPKQDLQGTNGDPKNIPYPRRSFYQSDLHNADYFFNDKDHPNINIGHPPINGMIATLLNYILYQKLGILSDVASNHLFNILASSLLVFFVVYFAATILSRFSALVAFFSLTLYPLLFAETHFNIKDPAETAFITGTILFFYKSLDGFSIRWLIFSIVFFSLGLGTKFNILFLPLIIIPYLIIRYGFDFKKLVENIKKNKRIRKYILAGLILGPVILFLIVVPPWIYIWQDWRNIFNIIGYYEYQGTSTKYQPESFYIYGFNTYPSKWILYTTPPVILFLSFLGIASISFKMRLKNRVEYLWLLMFLVPILRVTFPNTSLYGGVRQIMEFIPGLALLSSLGSHWLIEQFRQRHKLAKYLSIVILLLFIYPSIVLIKLHPYQNVYFNNFIGGLSGAKKIKFPSWGNSYGSAYLDGIKWLNQNAQRNSKLSLIQGTPANAPLIYLRKDINLNNRNFSGINRNGEYLMELTFNDTVRVNNYAWEYVERFLIPTYELKVDGVAILKIWKNDIEHTKKEFQKNEEPINEIEFTTSEVKFGYEVQLSRLVLFLPSKECDLKNSHIEISKDDATWIKKGDDLGFEQIKDEEKRESKSYFFAGDLAKKIRVGGECKLEKIPQVFILK